MRKNLYPRSGRLALGDYEQLSNRVERMLTACRRSARLGETVNLSHGLCGLLEDVFQSGVVVADEQNKRVTSIPKGGDRVRMHKARASVILSMSAPAFGGRSRDEESVIHYMTIAGARALRDGAQFGNYGKLDISPLFDFEPTRLWREVPTRYDHCLLDLCEIWKLCRPARETPLLETWDIGTSTEFVVRLPSHLEQGGIKAAHFTRSGISALVRSGHIVAGAEVGRPVEITEKAILAFDEYEPHLTASRNRRRLEMRAAGYNV